MTIPLQKGIIYGPVRSRRLGSSLGINVLPVKYKVCTFNCVYCQYGWTRFHEKNPAQNSDWPGVGEVLAAVEKSLSALTSPPAYLTFSGNGEPTLHPSFAELVEGVIHLRNRYAPQSKTAILSNSSTVSDANIRRAISRLDVKIMKLDCGTEEIFRRFNHPCEGINLQQIVFGLKQLQDVTIQALFCDGPEGNYKPDQMDSWVKLLRQIAPVQVQLYTLDRGYPSDKIFPLPEEKLMAVKKRLDQMNINARVYF